MNTAKLDAFLDIARGLNRIGITPLLCGSVGLEVGTGRDWQPGDLDIHVPGDPRGWDAPDAERIHRLDEIKQVMAELGYAYVDAHEHAFEAPDGLRVEMGDLDELPSFAGVALDDLAHADDDRARYLLLGPQQHLALYEASLADGYRADDRGHKDQAKVDYLRVQG